MPSCPHCGTRLPIVVDAFCLECRKSLDKPRPPEPLPRRTLTLQTDMTRWQRLACWSLLGVGWLMGTWFFFLAPAPVPGSLEDTYSRIQVGMSRQEVVRLLLASPATDVMSVEGRLKGGGRFSFYLGWVNVNDIPAPEETKECVFNVEDSEGWEVVVVVGQGGTVTGKSFHWPDLESFF